MRVVIQRVSEASVTIGGLNVGAIGRGFVILLGIEHEDSAEDVGWLVGKIAAMRVFPDEDGKMNLSLKEIDGQVLVISQFTLHASTRKGNRPGFTRAARPEVAVPLYEAFLKALETELASPVARGVFGADMKVALINDGPVTICMDSRAKE